MTDTASKPRDRLLANLDAKRRRPGGSFAGLVALTAVLLLAISSAWGCSCEGEEDNGNSEEEISARRIEQLENFNSALKTHIGDIRAASAATDSFVSATTWEYLNTIEQVETFPDADWKIQFELEPPGMDSYFQYLEDTTNAMIRAVEARNKTLLSSYRLLKAAGPLELGSSSSALMPGQNTGSELETREDPLIFVTLGALVGGYLLNRTLHSAMDSAVETRTEPVREKLASANEAELEIIRNEMGASQATAEELAAELARRPAHEQLDIVKRTEAEMVRAAMEEPDVEMISPSEVMRSIARAARELGETAVAQVAGWWATGGGGQGVANLVEALGGSASLAFVADLIVTLKEGQPLDLLKLVLSRETEEKQVVPPPTGGQSGSVSSVEEAIEVLESESSPPAEVNEAVVVLTRDVLAENAVEAVTNADGSVTTQVPVRQFADIVDAPTTSQVVVEVPVMGPSDVIISATGSAPELISDVDFAEEGAAIEYTAQTIETFVEDLGKETEQEQELTIRLPDALPANADIEIVIECDASSISWPATLDVNQPSGAIISWTSPLSTCPFSVWFNGAEGTYSLNFTLTGSEGKVLRGSTSLTIVEAQVNEETWLDTTSGLIWLNRLNRPNNTYSSAVTYCADLDVGGYAWRLPTIDELRSLVRDCPNIELGGTCNITDGGCVSADCMDSACSFGCTHGSPRFDGAYCPAELAGCGARFWSSTIGYPRSDNPDFCTECKWNIDLWRTRGVIQLLDSISSTAPTICVAIP